MTNHPRTPTNPLYWPARRSLGTWAPILFIVGVTLRLAYFRFHYYPIMDDWYLYGEGHQLPAISFFVGNLAIPRPMMGWVNAFLVARLWHDLSLVYMAVALLNGLNSWLMFRLAQRIGLPVSPLFAVIVGFFPLWDEAIFWIAAAVPLVIGTTAMLLTLHLALNGFELPTRLAWPKVMLLSLVYWIACGFYEPVAALLMTATILLWWRHRHQPSALPIGLASLFGSLGMGLYYAVMWNNASLAGRVNTSLATNLVTLGQNLRYVWLGPPIRHILTHGLSSGWQSTQSHWQTLALFGAILLLTAPLLWTTFDPLPKCPHRLQFYMLATGILLAVAGTVPFIIQPWVAFRDTYPMGIGIALTLDSLLVWLRRHYLGRLMVVAAAFAVVMTGSLVGFHDLSLYRATSLTDQRVARAMAALGSPTRPLLLVNTHWADMPMPGFYGQRVEDAFYQSWSSEAILGTVTHKPFQWTVLTISNGATRTLPKSLSHYQLIGLEWHNDSYPRPVPLHLIGQTLWTPHHTVLGRLIVSGTHSVLFEREHRSP